MSEVDWDSIFIGEEETWLNEIDCEEDDSEVDKKLHGKAMDLLTKYGHKWAEIHALNHVWFYMSFGFEFGTEYPKSYNLMKMYKAAPMFFSLSRIAIERTSRIELVKLFDGSESASIRYLRDYLEENALLVCHSAKKAKRLIEKSTMLKDNLDAYWDSISSLKEIRNKHLAHNDIQFFTDLESLYTDNQVLIHEVFKIIETIGVYLDDMAQLIQPNNTSASVCPKYHEIMDIQSLEMYFNK